MDTSCGYERVLDDDALEALDQDVHRRIQDLLAQGVALPIAQIENHHLIGLLEIFVGRAKAERVREWHLRWTDGQLSMVEEEIRVQFLQRAGVLSTQDPADLPGFP